MTPIIREVIAAHPEDVLSPDGWQDSNVWVPQGSMYNRQQRDMLSPAFSDERYHQAGVQAPIDDDGHAAALREQRNLGF